MSGFVLACNTAEIPSVANKAVVTPTTGPKGVVVVNGGGSVAVGPDGCTFTKGGAQNANAGFLEFKNIGSLFNPTGAISVDLLSNYDLADRPVGFSSIVDVWDGLVPLFALRMYSQSAWAAGAHLSFYWSVGSLGTMVPIGLGGTEDDVFGKGKRLQVKLRWDATTATLSINGVDVESYPHTSVHGNWPASSFMLVGALAAFGLAGAAPRIGYYGAQDTISNLVVE